MATEADQYQYQHQVRGVLDRPNRDGSQRQAIASAYDTLGGIDVEDEYGKLATGKMYFGSNITPGVESESADGVTSQYLTPEHRELFDQPLSQLYGDTHGGVNYRKVDKDLLNRWRGAEASVQNLLDTRPKEEVDYWRSKGAGDYSTYGMLTSPYKGWATAPYVGTADKYNEGNMIHAIMDSSRVYVEKSAGQYKLDMDAYNQDPTVGPWGSDPDAGAEPDRYFIDPNATSEKFNQTVDEMLADEGDSYMAYYRPGGESGSSAAYNDMKDSITSSITGAKDQYVGEYEATIATERGKVDDIVASNAARVSKREDTYRMMFGQTGKARGYL